MPNKKPPYFEVAHIDSYTLSFVLGLRNAGDSSFLESLNEEERKLIEDEKKKNMKKKPCQAKGCASVELTIQMAIVEKALNQKKVRLTKPEVDEIDEECQGVEATIKAVGEETSSLRRVLDSIVGKVQKGECRLHEISHERKILESKIRALTEELVSLQPKETDEFNVQDQSFTSSNSRSSAVATQEKYMDIIGPDEYDKPMKHTGHFHFSAHKQGLAWSCCLDSNRKSYGCIDDQSVGVVSTLVIKDRAAYRPYSANPQQRPGIWKRTAQPATPPLWPPSLAINTFEMDKHASSSSGKHTYSPLPRPATALAGRTSNNSSNHANSLRKSASSGVGNMGLRGLNSSSSILKDSKKVSLQTQMQSKSGSSSLLIPMALTHGSQSTVSKSNTDQPTSPMKNKTKISKTLNGFEMLKLANEPMSLRIGEKMVIDNEKLTYRNRFFTSSDGVHMQNASTVSPSESAVF